MDITLAGHGIILGFTIAAAVGPHRPAGHPPHAQPGWLVGIVSGLGVATADGLYGAVAAFGLTAISDGLVALARPLGVIGGSVLIVHRAADGPRQRQPTMAARETTTITRPGRGLPLDGGPDPHQPHDGRSCSRPSWSAWASASRRPTRPCSRSASSWARRPGGCCWSRRVAALRGRLTPRLAAHRDGALGPAHRGLRRHHPAGGHRARCACAPSTRLTVRRGRRGGRPVDQDGRPGHRGRRRTRGPG